MPLKEASNYFAVLNVAQILGKLAFGAALDSNRLAVPAALVGCALALAGCVLLLREEQRRSFGGVAALAAGDGGWAVERAAEPAALRMFVAVYGVGIGSSFALLASAPGREFRHLSCFSELQAIFGCAYLAGGLAGVACTGWLVRAAANYTSAFAVVTSSAALTLVTYAAFELAPRTAHQLPPAGGGDADANSPERPTPHKLVRGRSRTTPRERSDLRRFAQLLEPAAPAADAPAPAAMRPLDRVLGTFGGAKRAAAAQQRAHRAAMADGAMARVVSPARGAIGGHAGHGESRAHSVELSALEGNV